jgi:hypothetical protein
VALRREFNNLLVFGSSAKWKFRIYWSLIYPFAGLIRKAILRRVKSEAESKGRVGSCNAKCYHPTRAVRTGTRCLRMR